MSENLSDAISQTAPVKRFEFVYNRKKRSWDFEFVGWDGTARTVQFRFEHTLKTFSPDLVHKKLHDGMNIGVYDTREGKDDLLTTLRVDIPDFWPDRDPHMIYTEEEVNELRVALVREVHGAWLQRLADGWRNAACEKSHALSFSLTYKED